MATLSPDSELTTRNRILPPKQRMQLLRTTRKLEAVLGEIPVVIDASEISLPPLSPSASPHARSKSMDDGKVSVPDVAAVHIGPSSVSLPNLLSALKRLRYSHGPSVHARPVLVIELPTKLDEHMLSSEPSLSPAPLSPVLPSPITPTDANSDTSANLPDFRLRKMSAKVSRTLGENVPSSLLFPALPPAPPPTPDSSAPSSLISPKDRRRASTLSVPESIRERLRSVSRASISSIPLPPMPTSSVVDGATTALSRSVSTISAKSKSPPKHTRLRRPSISASIASLRSTASQSTGSAASYRRDLLSNDTHRREMAWSGEWGGADVHNMQDVVRELRELKLK
ncbi:hypothetical protein C8F01DRAFT_1377421 [Mycena amicta]|nr:hypothetical protein C8F01DRAFT_1377421 [Mycena amicta]